jgi:Mg-chelatase subunit ChlD
MTKRAFEGLFAVLAAAATILWADPAGASGPAKIAGDPRPRIEAVFVLDTTGSMGGLIHAAKEKIWSIASSMAQARPTPEIRIGLVAYRDRGDAYVTSRTDLTDDLDAVYATLMDYQADGGGDGPESVNQALHEAVNLTRWSTDPDTYRVIFLVGDFPPHMDYQDDVPYQASCKAAAERGLVINAIQCGGNSETSSGWGEIARLSDGDFFQVEQSGGDVIASTPYDDELAALGASLEDTKIYYGTAEDLDRASGRERTARAIKKGATSSAKARRAAFNASEAGRDNFLGGNELIDAVGSGRVRVKDIPLEQLPADLRGKGAEDIEREIRARKGKRERLQGRIATLAKKRQAHIEKELEATADKGKMALSQRLYDSVRKQAGKSLRFESDMAAH